MNVPRSTPERRINHKLRECFDDACELCAPFFDTSSTWSGQPMVLSAAHALRATYPELDEQEICLLLAAVEDYYRRS